MFRNCDLYIYADDNRAGVCGRTHDEICSGLGRTVASILHWLQINFMQANLSKFQFMLFSKNRDEYNLKLAPDVSLVSCPSVHLLGVTLDCKLSFTDHILNLCKKARKSVNALGRLSEDLDVKLSWFYFSLLL